MPKYFTHLASTNAPKNHLQRRALDLLETSSNRLITDPSLLVKELSRIVEKLNANNPRCTPLVVRSYGSDPNSIGVTLGETFTVSFHIYRVKEDQ